MMTSLKDMVHDMVNDYQNSGEYEDGLNTVTLSSPDGWLEVDVEMYNEADIEYDSGNYDIPPSCSGKCTLTPRKVFAKYYDEESDTNIELDMTKDFDVFIFRF